MAGSDNFTGQNIQDSYQRVLQISSSGELADGTGSVVPLLLVTASYAISSSVETTHELSSSHAETASVATRTQNALTVSTGLDLSNSAVNWTGEYARTLTLDLTEVIATDGGNRILTSDADGTLTAEPYLSFDGNNLFGSGSETGFETAGYVSASTIIVINHITASGNISSSGTITANSIRTNGDLITIGSGLQIREVDASTGAGPLLLESANPSTLMVAGDIYAHTNITASGNISASVIEAGNELWLNDKLRISNNVVGQRISGSGEIFFASNKFEFSDTNNSIEGPPEFMRINGDTNVLGHITASSNISASGYVYAQRVYLDNQIALGNDGTSIVLGNDNTYPIRLGKAANPITMLGNITASGNISASGNLIVESNRSYGTLQVGDKAQFVNGTGWSASPISQVTIAGDLTVTTHITASGNISGSDIEASGDITANFYNSLTSGTGYKLSGAKSVYTHDSATIFGGAATTAITGSNILLGRTTATNITASGNIITAGTVTADSFIGQRVFIAAASSNIPSPTQNRMFYGGSNGLSSNTWNVGIGETSGSYGAAYIPPQYINNLHIIPCGVKNVTLKSYSRIGSSQIPSIWIYTGSMQNDTNAPISMGFAASQSIHASATNNGVTTGTGTDQYHINITGSKAFAPNPGHELIAVILKNQGSGTQAWRFNYRVDGITTE